MHPVRRLRLSMPHQPQFQFHLSPRLRYQTRANTYNAFISGTTQIKLFTTLLICSIVCNIFFAFLSIS